MILLYGADYCAYALRSIAPFVDELFVFLALEPSHGTQSSLICPDSTDQMRAAIQGAGLGDKLRLIEGRWNSEGEHRAEILKYVSSGDLIVVVDADEIWVPDKLEAAIGSMNANPDHRWYKVRMVNFFRSFNWICCDPMTQDRLIRVGPENGVIYSPFSTLPKHPDVAHFGYARKPIDVAFKASIHGHHSEWREGWLEQKFLAWQPNNQVGDLHPTCVGFWETQPFDKNSLPVIMMDHPYFEMPVIE